MHEVRDMEKIAAHHARKREERDRKRHREVKELKKARHVRAADDVA